MEPPPISMANLLRKRSVEKEKERGEKDQPNAADRNEVKKYV